MKIFLFITCSILMMACCTQKETAMEINNKTSTEKQEDSRLVGKVRVNQKGCPFYLEVLENGEMVTMYPVNLDEKLKKDGIKIKFSYIPSRALQPDNCNVNKVVSIENVIQLP